MKLLKSLLALSLSLCLLPLRAQVQLSPVAVGEVEGLESNQKEVIENKLRSILTARDMLSRYGASRFVLAARLAVVDKEVLATAPTKVVLHLTANISIGDGLAGLCFGSYDVALKGVGATEQAAVASAVRSISTSSRELSDMLAEATKRIVDYYNKEAANIMARADALAGQGQYEEAICELALVPEECRSYAKVQEKTVEIYRQYVRHNTALVLTQAKALWAGDPTPENADRVMAMLADADPLAPNYAEVQAFIQKVEAAVRRENNQRRADAVAIKKAQINAAREVAVAFAKNQPKTINHYILW